MPLGVAFALLAFGCGWLVLRTSGVGKGPTSMGLAPAVGLAALALVTVARAAAGLTPVLGTILLLGLGASGLTFATRDGWVTARYVFRHREHRLAFALLASALVIPVVVTEVALRAFEVPLSTHDGAYHVEVIQSLRDGASLEGWYPPGFHATVAALLGVAPWVDTARGTFEAAHALTYLAPLAVFGLGCAVWRNTVYAATGALLLALTFEYPFYPQVRSLWPLAMALIMVWGIWSSAILYLERPAWSLALCSSILAAGIVVTHGSEIYTVSLGVVLLALRQWRQIPWRALIRHLPLALLATLALAAPYLPTLLGWVGGGGAIGAAYLDVASSALLDEASTGMASFAGVPESTWTTLTNTFGAGLVIDTPVRMAFLIVGLAVAVRSRSARVLVTLLFTFTTLAWMFSFTTYPPIMQLFALTFPWGVDYRVAMIQTVPAALLGGAGAVATARWIAGLPQRWHQLRGVEHTVALRRAGAFCRLVSVLIGLVTASGLALLYAEVAGAYNSYSADDAAAMGWLTQHTEPGDVIANDASTDAGIWAPYKARVLILSPQATSLAATDTGKALLRGLGRLDDAESRAFACTHNLRYLYHGAKQTAWKKVRYFPSIVELRQNTEFEEVFSSGQAAVFRLRLACA